MNRILKTTMFLIIVFTTGCYYNNEEKLYPVVSTDCNLTEVTFSGTIKPILQATCFTCHSNSNYLNSGGGIKLENYADIKIMAGNGKLMGAVKEYLRYVFIRFFTDIFCLKLLNDKYF